MAIDEDDFDRVYHAVFGNGKVGMDELLRSNTKRLDTLGDDITKLSASMDKSLTEVRQSVDALRAERKADYDKAIGRRELYGWVKFGLGIVAVLISIVVGFGQLGQQWMQVEDLLRRIPNLPE